MSDIKKERKKLQDALDNSCKLKRLEESKLKEGIKELGIKYENAITDLNDTIKAKILIEKEVQSLLAQQNEILANQKKIENKIQASYEGLNKTQEELKEAVEQLKDDKDVFDNYVKEEYKKVYDEEKRLNSLTRKSIEERDILNIEKNELDIEKNKILDRRNDLNEELFQFTEEKKKHQKELEELRARVTTLDIKTKEAQTLWNKSQKQLDIIKNKENRLLEREEELRDKEAELLALDTRTKKQLRRVEYLREGLNDTTI